ncbi:MAG: hypothetical protein EAZ54_11765 [Curvibacter sp.]|nr:MAG: hypothetical protein EAZ54_11765 [Curvibacter sp.]
MNNVAIVNELPVSVVGESGTPEPAPYQRTRITALENMTVRSSLWLAFASVLLGAVVIGVFSLFQMGRLNASTKAIYEQEYAAGQAAEEARGLILRASRAQTQLLTATTAAERNTLGAAIETSLGDIAKRLDIIKGLSTSEETIATSQELIEAMGKWAKRQSAYIALVKEQPLDLMQMSTDVPTEDARLLNDTRKLEKLVDALVEQRAQSAKATIENAGQIYQSSQMWVVGIMVLLLILSLVISAWVTGRLSRQLGGEPAYAKSIASRIADGDLTMQIQLAPKDNDSLLYSLRDMQMKLSDTMRDIADTSLQICLELLNNVSKLDPNVASAFYENYYIMIFQDVFYVMTDREHKSGFKYQTQILAQLCNIVDSGMIKGPLFAPNQVADPASMTNQQFIRDYLMQLLQGAFTNLNPVQIRTFVLGLFGLHHDLTLFKQHLRDFLVQLKEFSSGDTEDGEFGNAELYLEERERELADRKKKELETAMRVPGLVKPSERADDMDD